MTEEQDYYAQPRAIGSVEIWHTTNGWMCRRAGATDMWLQASKAVIELAKQYETMQRTINAEQGRAQKRWSRLR